LNTTFTKGLLQVTISTDPGNVIVTAKSPEFEPEPFREATPTPEQRAQEMAAGYLEAGWTITAARTTHLPAGRST